MHLIDLKAFSNHFFRLFQPKLPPTHVFESKIRKNLKNRYICSPTSTGLMTYLLKNSKNFDFFKKSLKLLYRVILHAEHE